MKKLTHNAFKVVIVAAFLATTFYSCKKKENVIPLVDLSQKQTKDNNVSVETLKKYFAERINVSIDEVIYDEETGWFQYNGVDQISKKDLQESYQVNFLKH